MKTKNLWVFLAGLSTAFAQAPNKAHESVIKEINQKEKQYGVLSKQIWTFAEVG